MTRRTHQTAMENAEQQLAQPRFPRDRHPHRWLTWLGTTAFCVLPTIGFAAVELTEFRSGTPIRASEVNDNFVSLNEALDGSPVRAAQPVTMWTSSDPTAQPVMNAELDITTRGGLVEVRLLPEAGGVQDEPSRITVEGPVDQALRFGCFLERSSDGGSTWEQRGWITTQDSQAAGTVWIAPTMVAFVDDPPAGEWRYRLSAEPDGSATSVGMVNVRLFAREMAMAG